MRGAVRCLVLAEIGHLKPSGGLGSSAGLQFGPRHPRAAAGTGVLAFPWPFRVALTHPPAVFANEAFHGRCGFNLELEQY